MNKDIAIDLIETGKLTDEQILKICSSVKDKVVWKKTAEVVNLAALDKKLLAEIEEGSKDTQVTISTIKVGKFSTEDLLSIGKKCLNHNVWDTILHQVNFTGFTDDTAIEFAKKANSSIIWVVVFHQVNLEDKTPEVLLKMCELANEKELYLKVLRLGKLSCAQLMDLGWMAKNDEVWKAISEQLKQQS